MESATILGCRVDAVGSAEAVRRIADLARGTRCATVVTLGTEMIVHAQRDAHFRDIVNASDLSLCDTIGVKYAAWLHGAKLEERVSGVDLIAPLCAALAEQGSSVYFLGAKGDTAARAAEAVRARCPALVVAGAHDGYFTEDSEAEIASAIAASGANVLLAGLGTPRQEIFLNNRLQETGCGVGIGVGGSFDVLAGNVARAPAVWQRLNLEWLYRLVREPHRWRRQLALPQFVWLVLRELAIPRSPRRFS